jgi:ectoine hydroxylase-related dioxygenase (phytanoyl-CoA dioxygenase family)
LSFDPPLVDRGDDRGNIAASFHENGYCITPRLISGHLVDQLRKAADRLFTAAGGARAGLRDAVSRDEAFRAIANADCVRELANSVLGSSAFVVRSVLFDKTPEANWDVVWHQDVTIAVSKRVAVDGFGPWSIKGGVVNVQPPASVLERMVTIRLHLDDCGLDNGPLLVVPGSHQRGFVDVRTLDTGECDAQAIRCCAEAGMALVMYPLLLHASRKSAVANHRRVLHMDFAADQLPHPLRWAVC